MIACTKLVTIIYCPRCGNVNQVCVVDTVSILKNHIYMVCKSCWHYWDEPIVSGRDKGRIDR